jgi:hypothetical protein
MIEVNDTRSGFFSSLFFVLNCCHVAEENDDDIKINNFSKLYDGYQIIENDNFSIYNRNKNSYFQYFIDPYLNINKDDKYSKIFKFPPLNNRGLEEPILYKNIFGENVTIFSSLLNYEKRKYISFLIKKYILIKDEIKNKIDSIYNQNFKNKKVLGLHIRQTDHGEHGKLLDFDFYVNEIEKNIDNFDILYVMSDNYEYINKIENIFPNKIFYIKDIIRSNKKNNICVHLDTSITDRYKLGEDVLIETMLMCKCDSVLLTNSNICNFILCYNPDIKYYIMDLNLKNF